MRQELIKNILREGLNLVYRDDKIDRMLLALENRGVKGVYKQIPGKDAYQLTVRTPQVYIFDLVFPDNDLNAQPLIHIFKTINDVSISGSGLEEIQTSSTAAMELVRLNMVYITEIYKIIESSFKTPLNGS